MAEKRFFWLKLNEDYFTNPKIKKLRKVAGGDTFTIIYLKMQLLSVANKGVIEFEKIEKTFEDELALKLDEEIEDVKLTLAYLHTQGLIEENNNEFLLIEAASKIGSEVDSAERVRRFRENKENKMALKEPKTNALRQRQFKAKEVCKENQHIPYIEDYQNNKRYNGNYYLVFKRDRMKCSICDSIANLCIHHIDGYDENKPQNSNENKMITLCRECHSQVHSGSLSLSNILLESISYYEESNESNEACNASVTPVKQISLSISNSNSISNLNGSEVEKQPKLKSFQKPTLTEVQEYCRERNNHLNADNFIDFYESKGWLVGKTKMKDWKAAIRTWESRDKEKVAEKNKARGKIEGRHYTQEELDALFDDPATLCI